MQKEYRLKQNEKIQELVRRKQRVTNELYTVYYQSIVGNAKIAVTASKKYGNAVKRNHAKRVMREILRPNVDVLAGFQILVVVKEAFGQAVFSIRARELERLINKIIRRKELNK